MKRESQVQYSDVDYGISSVAISAAGLLVVSTTGAAYHGIAYISLTTGTQIFVFDSPSGTTGNLLDVVYINSSDKPRTNFIPVMAKFGITIGVTGTGGRGAIFYGPKG